MGPQVANAYRHVHRRMALGSLSPGDVISESALAGELGCSRTPVGEALRLLADDGLVKQVPRYGTIVREIPAEELVELFEVRESIEIFAAKKATSRITAPTIAELRDVCNQIDALISEAESTEADAIDGNALRRFLALDMAFHLLIISASGNARLLKIAKQTKSVALIFQARRGRHTLERIREANRDHRLVVGALEARDADQACSELERHIHESNRTSIEGAKRDEGLTRLGQIELPDVLDHEE